MANVGNYCLAFDREKATESVKYITRVVGLVSKYDLAMLCFIAEMMHLQEFGRPIVNDRYVALSGGTVCSGVFSIAFDAERQYIGGFGVCDSLIKSNGDVDLSLLSESDISALDWAINFSRSEFSWRSISQTGEWQRAFEQSLESNTLPFRLMDFKTCVLALKHGESLWEHINKNK